MLRLNRNRKQSTKGKSSNKTKPMDNVPSKPYEENYNDVILNDLVPEEKRSEFGLESETPKKNSKKSGGIKLNLGLKGKKNKKSTEASSEKTKDTSKNKSSNKESSKSEKIESKPSKSHKESQSSTDKSSGGKKKSNKPQEESKTSKGKKTSKGSNSKKTKSLKGSKASHSSVVEHEEKHEVVENESKKTPRPVVNPKRRRRRPEQEQSDTTRNFDEKVENEVEEIIIENEENIDSKGFRSIEEENPVEIEEVKSRFEDLVWSEDKFPKNK